MILSKLRDFVNEAIAEGHGEARVDIVTCCDEIEYETAHTDEFGSFVLFGSDE